MRSRSFRELRRLYTFDERFDYLALNGEIGEATFGFDRYINQQFYRSTEWRQVRDRVIARDLGRDLGIEGHEIHGKILIHHMNPMTIEEIEHGDYSILDPNFLIATCQLTHNAIHYGDRRKLPQPLVERRPGDTKLW